jgi:hypothetical protein
MVPVSERSSVDAPSGGNLVAMMIVLLPVGEAHPVGRLERIANETAERKRRHCCVGRSLGEVDRHLGQVSDNESQFSEPVGQTEGRTDVGPEIVEAPAEVLDEGMGSDNHPGPGVSL